MLFMLQICDKNKENKFKKHCNELYKNLCKKALTHKNCQRERGLKRQTKIANSFSMIEVKKQ